MTVGEAFLSAFIQVLFDRLASKNVVDIILARDNDKVLKKFQKTLLLIKAVLNDAEDKQVKNEAVRMWLVELKDVVYDAEDVLDDFATGVLRRRLESESQTTFTQIWNRVPTSLNPSNLMFDVGIESKIKVITERLNNLANERHELGLSEIAAGCPFKFKETSSMVNESYICGRDMDKEKIIRVLMENMSSHGDEEIISVIPIVGMPGVGKTTLAQVVFNDDKVNLQFELKAWVSVPDDFDVKIITGKILESATSRTCDLNSLQQLQVNLKAALRGKKFLVVLDDVWNKNYNEWIKLVAPFNGGAPGSAVIVTTRNAQVAKMVGTVESHYVNKLSEKDCWSVFVQHAFRSKTIDANQALAEIGEKIAQKCKGLPLAATTIGGILSSKHDEEWEHVMNFEIWDLAEEESDMLQALRLSYDQLPSHLKRCFAYCSILPKGFEFGEKELVLLWMAEGFLEQQAQKQMEDVGHEYFRDLLSASLFQRSSSNRSLYVMHDLINDLAQWVAGESCFKLDTNFHSHGQIKKRISKRARHASYVGGEYDGIQMFHAFKEAKSLRTFLPLKRQRLEKWSYITNQVPFKLLPELRCLRALSLRGYFISKLPDSISNLKHLRYLNLSCTSIRKLPESVCSLCNLQTLLLKHCFNLEELPSNMGDLINLRHLDITGAHSLTGMPHGIGKLTHLQTLSNFVLGKSGIRELMMLSNLQGILSVSRLEHVTDTREAVEAMLNKKVGIDVLKLKWSCCLNDESHIRRENDVLQMLQPHKTLTKLTVRCYGGISFPKWIGDPSFKSLVFLKLRDCANCTTLPILGNLHALRDLYIIGMKEVCCIDGGFYGDGCLRPFPSLERLHFMDMENWENWFPSGNNEQSDIFSSLQQLFIVKCPKLLGKLPENLPSLKYLLVKECERLMVTLSNLPLLCKLEVEGCKGLVLNCTTEFMSLNSMAISSISELTSLREGLVQGFKRVEKLKIVNCALDEIVLADWWGNEVWSEKHPHGLSSMLRSIEIRNFSVMRFIPKALMFNSHFLERLCICNCDSLVFVTTDQLPPTLKSLEISNCKNLQCLLDNGECSSSTITMQEDNNQNSGTSISHLEYIYIGWCPSLTCISRSGELPEAVKLLFIWNCSELTCLSMKGQLPKNLEKLEIQCCPMLDSIASTMHGNTSLESVQIWNCENLKSLPDGLHCLVNLKQIKIIGCPSLVSFPEEGFPTSCLTELCIMSCEKLEALPNCMHDLKSLKELEIGYCPSIQYVPEEGFPANLTSLWINDHNAWEAMFNWGLYKFTFLRDLTIIGVSMHMPLEELGTMLPSSLTSLTIQGFPQLKYMSSKGFHNLTSLSSLALRDLVNLTSLPSLGFDYLTSLEELSIYNCPKIFCLPKKGLPSSLLELYIQDCPLLKQQCMKDKGNDWSKIVDIPYVEIDGKFIYDSDDEY
ncbi:putative disease resistance RPP13-like protein 1 [Gastrolobium bilobum]|uniref:putative disease resistance RPP13-like protein 1 n=1 Tax=Gastrolobium bilobum TaxID=150636 RepID=UPI002AB1A7F4|nr:putative disease resistance RPP13-like protein 1 [Gastrolobium bilobum]